jgi:hypothetical protein
MEMREYLEREMVETVGIPKDYLGNEIPSEYEQYKIKKLVDGELVDLDEGESPFKDSVEDDGIPEEEPIIELLTDMVVDESPHMYDGSVIINVEDVEPFTGTSTTSTNDIEIVQDIVRPEGTIVTREPIPQTEVPVAISGIVKPATNIGRTRVGPVVTTGSVERDDIKEIKQGANRKFSKPIPIRRGN